MGWIYLTAYMAVMFVSIFVVLPYLKVRTDIFGEEELLIFGLVGSLLWPLAMVIVAGYFVIWIPGAWLFNKSEEFFKIKEPLPPAPSRVNAAKSSYRNIAYHDAADLDENEYSPSKET